jgi:multidrug efflux system membrane fusion protein
MAVFVLVLSLVLAGCSAQALPERTAQRSQRGGRSTEAVPVSTALVVSKPMPVTVSAVGAAESISSVQIHAQVTGQLRDIHFAEGQDVSKGQLLFELDPRPFELALAQAQAVLARDTAQNRNAQQEIVRYQALVDRGLISHEQYESVAATAAAAEATTGADQSAVDTAKLNLQFTRIIAPVSGRAGALMVHVGDLVRANDTMPMVTINQMAPINVSFTVPGKLLDDIRHYQAVAPLRVEVVPARADEPHPSGRVTFIDNQVDPATGTIKLKALFENANRQLWPGEFVNANLQLTTDTHAVVAPAAAVQTSQKGQYVYVVKEDQTVDLRPVTVSRTAGADAVIASGLEPGETVVTDGQLRLTPGARVADSAVPTSGATR